MARAFLTAIDLGKNELQNAVVQNLGTAPASPVKGQLYFNSTGGDNTLYWWDGTTWVPAKATASVAFGNVVPEPTFGSASANGSSGNASRSDHAHGNPTHVNADHAAINLSALATPTTAVSFNSQRITSLADPTAATDGANKQYVDNAIAGLSWKDPVLAASTANVNIASPGGVIDGMTPSPGDRILLKDQSTASQNGIYVYNGSAVAMTRATDADTGAEMEGAAVFVLNGSTNADRAYTCTTNPPITVGTTSLTWAQFGGSQVYTAGAGLTGTTTFDVGAGLGITVAADTVGVDLTYTDQRYDRHMSAPCAAATSTVVNHNYNNQHAMVQVYRTTTPFDQVECDIEHTDANNVTVRFATAPAGSAFRIVVAG